MKRVRLAAVISFLNILCLSPNLSAQASPAEGGRQTVKVQAIRVKGSRLADQSIIRLAGIQAGQTIDEAKLRQALQNANASGLFDNINYNYEVVPDSTDVVLELIVTDQTPLVKATIDIPKVDAEAVWKYLTMTDLLFTRELPPTVQAIKLYERYITKYLQSIGQTDMVASGEVIGSAPPTAVIFEAVKLRKVRAK